MQSPRIIEIPIQIKNTKFLAMIDTGSAENYIPEHVAEKQDLEIQELIKEKTVEIANGSVLNVKKYCELKFKIVNDNNTEYKTIFILLRNPSDILILGMRFLSENDALINLKEGFINLDGAEYEIGFKTRQFNVSDFKIIEKSKIFSAKDKIKDEIDEIVSIAKVNNPILGEIKMLNIKLSSEVNSKGGIKSIWYQ
ncbi:hypothetical protein DMUE_4661 [Dictyocoela muelleri]|nr:hypothetical protein DMUE_4661 [Dictyocoela muelleri]